MRKIVIPQDALDRHQEKLGRELLKYLDRLAKGGGLVLGKEAEPGSSEDKNKNENPKEYKAEGGEQEYWKWVHDQFDSKHIPIAPPYVLLKFAIDNKAKLKGTGLRFKEIIAVSKALFAWDKFRQGNVLVYDEPDTEGGDEGNSRENVSMKISWSEAKNKIAKWEGWSISEFVRQLDVRYCPYCNAETVGVVDYVEHKEWITAKKQSQRVKNTPHESFSAIDHILPKDDYPLLALSLYNLVPACFRCNSQFKGDKGPFGKNKILESGDGKSDGPLKALHPYVHNVHKWFRFDYRPRAVEDIFLNEDSSKRNNDDSPLSITLKIPALTGSQSLDKDVYFESIRGYLDEFHILDVYRDLYATEINEILKMEMICTPTFVETMKGAWPGMGDEDFDLVFRRTSLDPREINKHRFAKLIIDLHKQIGDEVFLEEWGKNSDEEQSAKARREAHQAAWEARKKVIEESFHEKLSSSSAK